MTSVGYNSSQFQAALKTPQGRGVVFYCHPVSRWQYREYNLSLTADTALKNRKEHTLKHGPDNLYQERQRQLFADRQIDDLLLSKWYIQFPSCQRLVLCRFVSSQVSAFRTYFPREEMLHMVAMLLPAPNSSEYKTLQNLAQCYPRETWTDEPHL